MGLAEQLMEPMQKVKPQGKPRTVTPAEKQEMINRLMKMAKKVKK